jgi:hypothetical protein
LPLIIRCRDDVIGDGACGGVARVSHRFATTEAPDQQLSRPATGGWLGQPRCVDKSWDPLRGNASQVEKCIRSLLNEGRGR